MLAISPPGLCRSEEERDLRDLEVSVSSYEQGFDV